ncbi:MAG: beta-ketoacyl-[acyl-carrier-protein] synthase family protein [Chloroflexi bacterium]|nr:beta-ketoacyl-[acyl-carrier-protein] synthase family protein [Chloroflexota bacterium]
MTQQRVVITGIGALTPIGHGVDGLWAGVLMARSAVRRITRFDATPFRCQLGAEIDDLPVLDGRRGRRLDRFSALAVIAARQAVADAGLEGPMSQSAGCYVGTALGGVAFAEEQHAAYLKSGARGVSPALALSVFGAAGSSNVAIELGLNGPCGANSNSCASGAIAIGDAFRLVRDGHTPMMLAGGVEAPLAPLTFGSFALIRAMSIANEAPQCASRPFDAARDGFVMGEGAAMLVLEALDHAIARGACVYAEVRGYGTTTDAHHMLAPLPDGAQAARAMRLALDDAGVSAPQVDYVNAHASSTQLGDRAEAHALLDVVGPAVPVSGTKGMYGHPLGASGAIETAICALAIKCGFVPGTTNLVQPDPECQLNLVPPCGLDAKPAVVLNNAFGFGGINAALVLSAP